jgi:hypothetical protein
LPRCLGGRRWERRARAPNRAVPPPRRPRRQRQNSICTADCMF